MKILISISRNLFVRNFSSKLISFSTRSQKFNEIQNAKVSIRYLENGDLGEGWAKNHENGWKANGRGATNAPRSLSLLIQMIQTQRYAFVNSILTSGVCRLLFRRNKLPRTAAALYHALSIRAL